MKHLLGHLIDWLNKDNNPATDELAVSNLTWVVFFLAGLTNLLHVLF